MPGARLKPLPVPLQRSREEIGTVVVALAVLVVVLAMIPILRAPASVRRLTLVNPTAYQVNLETSGSPGDGWFDLGTAPREREVVLEGVADQGEKWTFRFSSGGVFASEMVLSRTDLERGKWRVHIPDGIAVPLHDAGLATSAS
ncbi:MAG: hypothetical protein M3Z84_03970 [Actinomycetota bacterium]|nr:hypothetical protein [Actinomycetota bacterium]